MQSKARQVSVMLPHEVEAAIQQQQQRMSDNLGFKPSLSQVIVSTIKAGLPHEGAPSQSPTPNSR